MVRAPPNLSTLSALPRTALPFWWPTWAIETEAGPWEAPVRGLVAWKHALRRGKVIN